MARRSTQPTPSRRLTKAHREILAIEKLVGPAGLRPLPFHFWHDAFVRGGGQLSTEFTAATEHTRQYYASVTLPALRPAADEEPNNDVTSTLADRSGRPTRGVPGAASASRSSRLTRYTRSRQ